MLPEAKLELHERLLSDVARHPKGSQSVVKVPLRETERTDWLTPSPPCPSMMDPLPYDGKYRSIQLALGSVALGFALGVLAMRFYRRFNVRPL
jgi:hypothetical protein